MNAINSWIRGCLPSKQTLVGIGQASAVLAMTAIGLRSIPFIKRNTNMLTTIGLGLIGGFGWKQIKGYLLKPIETRNALEISLNNWAQGAAVGENRSEAVRRILRCYDNQAESLNLCNLKLTTLPAEIGRLTHLQRLDLRRNRLTELPAEIGRLANLQVLDLSWNQLTELPAEIGSLTNLQFLDLSGNRLTELPAEIGSLTNLQVLGLKENQLTDLPAVIGSLKNLKKLYLYNNRLTELPAEIGRLTNLQVLDLSWNQLTDLPAVIGSLTNLEKLDLNWNQLTDLPAVIGSLTNLQDLGLSRNQLTTLPAAIGSLTNLQVLGLSSNQLTTLPAAIGNLRNLTSLRLFWNQLTELPAEIGNLRNLHALGLSGNQLTDLPAEIGNLRNLQVLGLSGNQLTELPAAIGSLTNLTALFLDRPLVEQVALSPMGTGNIRFLPGYQDPQEREAIIRQGLRALDEDQLPSIQEISQICDAIGAIAAGEREDVMNHALELFTPGMFVTDKIRIIRQVAAVQREQRADYVAARRNGMAGGARAAAEGVNVHAGNRDPKTKEAMELLRKHQGHITPDETQRYVKEFKEYLDACERPEQDLALRALVGPKLAGTHFGPLLDGELFSVNRLSLKGDEVTGRMWLYASTHPKVEEQAQAKEGMILALADSYEEDRSMVCNPGKTQRLAIRVLQGRLAGVNIDGLKVITAEQMLNEFFQNPTNQKIDKLDELIQAAEAFVNDRPAITAELKEQFLAQVREYADRGDIK